MKKKELKELEFIANGVLIENESIERMESDRRKRLLAASFVAVRNMTGMNRKEFAEWLAIPYRTMQDWELGTSQVPEYVLRLVAYKVLMEKERALMLEKKQYEELTDIQKETIMRIKGEPYNMKVDD